MEMTREKLFKIVESGLERKGWSWRRLATESKVTYDNINNFKRGSAEILKGNNLIKVLKALDELEEIVNLQNNLIRIEIEYYIGDKGFLLPYTANQKKMVALPPEHDVEDIVAVKITNSWLVPAIHPGDIIFYSRNNVSSPIVPPDGLNRINYVAKDGNPFSKYIGKPCIAEIDNKLILAVLYHGSRTDVYNLGTYNSPNLFKDINITNIYEIVYTKNA